jgi:endonuclease/exonuclease/phosphatase family metal-dependent hydrolase
MPTRPLTLVTWNVLAAPWAAPGFYPAELDAALLDRNVRADLVAARLASLDADVMCLQETTPPDLAVVLERLGNGYEVHQTSNGPELWSNWSTPERPWEPNGTAIVWHRDAFTEVRQGSVELSDDANLATTIDAQHVGSGRRFRVMSIHLDADEPEYRRVQLPVALAAFAPDPGRETVDVIAGDCNEDTVNTDLGTLCRDHGFDDALTELDRLEPTHPYARPADDYAPLARLDHVLVRGARPVEGWVVDSDVWAVPDPGRRLAEHLRVTGSDHLPVVISLR